MELFKAAITGAAAWLNPPPLQEEPPKDIEPDAEHEGLDISELGRTLVRTILSFIITHTLTLG